MRRIPDVFGGACAFCGRRQEFASATRYLDHALADVFWRRFELAQGHVARLAADERRARLQIGGHRQLHASWRGKRQTGARQGRGRGVSWYESLQSGRDGRFRRLSGQEVVERRRSCRYGRLLSHEIVKRWNGISHLLDLPPLGGSGFLCFVEVHFVRGREALDVGHGGYLTGLRRCGLWRGCRRRGPYRRYGRRGGGYSGCNFSCRRGGTI